MTEHGSSIFVFFFLGEYSSLILMSAFMSIFFLGGHHSPDLHKFLYEPFMYVYFYINSWINNLVNYDYAIDSYITDIYNNQYKDIYGKDNIYLNQLKDLIHNSSKDYLNNNSNVYDYVKPIDKEDTTDLFNLINDGIIYVINFFRNKNINYFIDSDQVKDINKEYITEYTDKDILLKTLSLLIDKIQGSYILGFKIIIVVFFFIWIRASFPRLRYDQLMSLCWKELLPLVFAYIIFTFCLFYAFDMMPFGTTF